MTHVGTMRVGLSAGRARRGASTPVEAPDAGDWVLEDGGGDGDATVRWIGADSGLIEVSTDAGATVADSWVGVGGAVLADVTAGDAVRLRRNGGAWGVKTTPTLTTSPAIALVDLWRFRKDAAPGFKTVNYLDQFVTGEALGVANGELRTAIEDASVYAHSASVASLFGSQTPEGRATATWTPAATGRRSFVYRMKNGAQFRDVQMTYDVARAACFVFDEAHISGKHGPSGPLTNVAYIGDREVTATRASGAGTRLLIPGREFLRDGRYRIRMTIHRDAFPSAAVVTARLAVSADYPTLGNSVLLGELEAAAASVDIDAVVSSPADIPWLHVSNETANGAFRVSNLRVDPVAGYEAFAAGAPPRVIDGATARQKILIMPELGEVYRLGVTTAGATSITITVQTKYGGGAPLQFTQRAWAGDVSNRRLVAASNCVTLDADTDILAVTLVKDGAARNLRDVPTPAAGARYPFITEFTPADPAAADFVFDPTGAYAGSYDSWATLFPLLEAAAESGPVLVAVMGGTLPSTVAIKPNSMVTLRATEYFGPSSGITTFDGARCVRLEGFALRGGQFLDNWCEEIEFAHSPIVGPETAGGGDDSRGSVRSNSQAGHFPMRCIYEDGILYGTLFVANSYDIIEGEDNPNRIDPTAFEFKSGLACSVRGLYAIGFPADVIKISGYRETHFHILFEAAYAKAGGHVDAGQFGDGVSFPLAYFHAAYVLWAHALQGQTGQGPRLQGYWGNNTRSGLFKAVLEEIMAGTLDPNQQFPPGNLMDFTIRNVSFLNTAPFRFTAGWVQAHFGDMTNVLAAWSAVFLHQGVRIGADVRRWSANFTPAEVWQDPSRILDGWRPNPSGAYAALAYGASGLRAQLDIERARSGPEAPQPRTWAITAGGAGEAHVEIFVPPRGAIDLVRYDVRIDGTIYPLTGDFVEARRQTLTGLSASGLVDAELRAVRWAKGGEDVGAWSAIKPVTLTPAARAQVTRLGGGVAVDTSDLTSYDLTVTTGALPAGAKLVLDAHWWENGNDAAVTGLLVNGQAATAVGGVDDGVNLVHSRSYVVELTEAVTDPVVTINMDLQAAGAGVVLNHVSANASLDPARLLSTTAVGTNPTGFTAVAPSLSLGLASVISFTDNAAATGAWSGVTGISQVAFDNFAGLHFVSAAAFEKATAGTVNPEVSTRQNGGSGDTSGRMMLVQDILD